MQSVLTAQHSTFTHCPLIPTSFPPFLFFFFFFFSFFGGHQLKLIKNKKKIKKKRRRWFANRRVDSVRKQRIRSELPRGGSNQGPSVPTEHERATVLFHPIPIPTRKQREQRAGLLESVGAQIHRRKAGRTEPVPPLVQRLMPLHALHSLTRHHVTDLPP
uniref:Uncharacterized protein n=1 Tax=Cajanus cajan TaxID=3821 RepID=A0A151T2E1_CAJCA|nr:hypothetical protein KK1_023643 [Cajanus cajan]